MATAPNRSGQALGWLAAAPTGTVTVQLNAAANWYAVAFTVDSARTLSAVRVFVSAVAGTLAGTDITCDLYDSTGSAGAPGASIETGKVPTATITAAGWYDFTGFTTALTANKTYWAVFKNVNAVPAVSNCTFRVVGGAFAPQLGGNTLNLESWGQGSSTNTGSTWTTSSTRAGHRIAYADGSYDGIPISQSTATAVGDGVYAAREAGMKFTSPLNATLRVAGLAMFTTSKTGTPTGSPRFGLWTGSTPVNLAYTGSFTINTAQWQFAYFSSVQTIAPGTICRVTLAETAQADASGNRFNLNEVTWDTDSNSVILLPWNGTCAKTYFDGTSTWTDSALGTSIYGHALLLDSAQEFNPGYARSLSQQAIGTH